MLYHLIHHFKKHMELYHVPLIKVNHIESFLYLLTIISSVMNIPQSSLLAKFIGVWGPVRLMNATFSTLGVLNVAIITLGVLNLITLGVLMLRKSKPLKVMIIPASSLKLCVIIIIISSDHHFSEYEGGIIIAARVLNLV